MSVLDKLTEGIVDRDLSKEGAALMSKWERTGLLEGMDSDRKKNSMARLLENQAKELLRETSAMASGDVEGFAAVAFPIVRRVFGGLVANDLVSVQPMSLPSGLIFFLDFTVSSDTGNRLGYESGESLYGGGKVGAEITGGVSLSNDAAEDSFYNLNNGYAAPTGTTATFNLAANHGAAAASTLAGTGDPTILAGTASNNENLDLKDTNVIQATAEISAPKLLQHDPDVTSGTICAFVFLPTTALSASVVGAGSEGVLDERNTTTIRDNATTSGTLVRRLTRIIDPNNGGDPLGSLVQEKCVLLTYTLGQDTSTTGGSVRQRLINLTGSARTFGFAIRDDFDAAPALGSVVGDDVWGLEFGQSGGGLADGGNIRIPEIDIKVDSIDIRAQTKKLKARWTPELSQDLNAYHNIDAEVELTSILSEQVALEIDQEVLQDLVKHATAGTQYWSRLPGRFLDRTTGTPISTVSNESLLGADFTGNVSEWYETLLETINDVSAQIHRKTLRGGANFIVVSPEVANILEFTAGFRGAVTHDDTKGTTGAVKVGSLSKKFDVYVNPYFYRNVVLVGRKGNSFLESGYVYAPYVPLQTTPLIYDPDTFVPNKGVMTRYGKKMVRPDMYGLVVVTDLLGDSTGG